MRKISPKELDANPIELIGEQWMLVTAGNLKKFNTMTASWGAMGELWNKPVAFVFIRPQRYTFEFTEREEIMTLSFFEPAYRPALTLCGNCSGRDMDKIAKTGLTPCQTTKGGVTFHEARLVLECRKLYSDVLKKGSFTNDKIPSKIYPNDDFHTMYIVEILNVWVMEQTAIRAK